MDSTAAKQVVVIEIEVDDLPISIDRQTSDVVTKIAVPINSKPVTLPAPYHRDSAMVPLAAVASDLLVAPGADSSLAAVCIAIPKPNDQFHKEMAIDPMPFASGGISKIRRIFPQIDLYDLTLSGLFPKVDERLRGRQIREVSAGRPVSMPAILRLP